jgi:hypothetical protein
MTAALTVLRRRRVYWEECVSKTWKINNPFGSDPSWTLNGCVRVVEDDGKILVELDISGYEVAYKLTDACFPVQYYIFSLEACFSNLVIEDDVPVSFDIIIKGCIGVSGSIGIFDYSLQECVNLYRHTVQLFAARLASQDVNPPSTANEPLLPLPYIEQEIAA